MEIERLVVEVRMMTRHYVTTFVSLVDVMMTSRETSHDVTRNESFGLIISPTQAGRQENGTSSDAHDSYCQ